MPNPERTNKLIDLIKAERIGFRMGDFYVDLKARSLSAFQRPGIHTCGSAMCLAGLINFYRITVDQNMDPLELGHFALGSALTAGEWLGLPVDCPRIRDLFFMGTHSVDGNEGYTYDLFSFDALPDHTRRKVAISLLEHLRDENVVDWRRALVEFEVEDQVARTA